MISIIILFRARKNLSVKKCLRCHCFEGCTVECLRNRILALLSHPICAFRLTKPSPFIKSWYNGFPGHLQNILVNWIIREWHEISYLDGEENYFSRQHTVVLRKRGHIYTMIVIRRIRCCEASWSSRRFLITTRILQKTWAKIQTWAAEEHISKLVPE